MLWPSNFKRNCLKNRLAIILRPNGQSRLNANANTWPSEAAYREGPRADWLPAPGARPRWVASFFKNFQQDNFITVAVCPTELARQWPMSEARWQFIFGGMSSAAVHCWCASTAELLQALSGAQSVHGNTNPHLPSGWKFLKLAPAPSLFAIPAGHYDSFSKYWRAVTKDKSNVDALLLAQTIHRAQHQASAARLGMKSCR